MARLRIQRISSFDTPELQPYATMKRPVEHHEQGIFVSEGTKVVLRHLHSRFDVVSLVIPDRMLAELEPHIAARPEPEIPVYLADKFLLEQLVGFSLFQGVMAVGHIPARETLQDILGKHPAPRLFVAIDALTNAENLGTLVRNAAAFNAQAMIVGETSACPFIRRAVRSSMGMVFQTSVVDAVSLAQSLRELRRAGVRCVAAHPHAEGHTLARTDLSGDVCLVFGSEGHGIRPEVLEACDDAAAIPMPPTVDSLNVAAAAAIFLYEANRQRGRM
jgi:tRNA G18 (ribose-2'-O)-methylase SpoU